MKHGTIWHLCGSTPKNQKAVLNATVANKQYGVHGDKMEGRPRGTSQGVAVS